LKKILILNRRDIRNPLSGGAEIYTHEIFKRLTDEYEITHFSSSFKRGLGEETIDDIHYIRKGGELTTHFFGFVFVAIKGKSYDLIIDQFNGIGFMTFGVKRSVLLIHQLYGDFWITKLGKAGYLFRFLEKFLLKLYKPKKVITVSESTRKDLTALGYKAGNIEVILNGIDYVQYSEKTKFEPIVMYLGRLVRTKNPEHSIKAFLMAREQLKDLSLYIVGDGEDRRYLQNKYGYVQGIYFLGFLSDADKDRWLRRASVLLVPSIREGWGQVVIQANMAGTPVIGYNVEGVRDAVIDGKTGWLVPRGALQLLADKIVNLFNDRKALQTLSKNALEYAKGFSWDTSAIKMKDFLRNATDDLVS